MRACAGYEGTKIVRIATLFTAYTFVRQNELRRMEWTDINLEDAMWRIPAAKMKMALQRTTFVIKLGMMLQQ